VAAAVWVTYLVVPCIVDSYFWHSMPAEEAVLKLMTCEEIAAPADDLWMVTGYQPAVLLSMLNSCGAAICWEGRG
jgi:hypothetical protein